MSTRALVLAAIVSVSSTASAQSIRDGELGFTLTLPAGFRDFPPGRAQPNTRYSWIEGEPGSDEFAIVGIEPMSGTIGREPLKPSEVPPLAGVFIELRREKWHDFDIDVIATHAGEPGERVFALVAQVPLKRRAIQVKVVGPDGRERELTALLRTLLASLDGESNWLTTSKRLKEGIYGGGMLLLLVTVAIWSRVRASRRRASS